MPKKVLIFDSEEQRDAEFSRKRKRDYKVKSGLTVIKKVKRNRKAGIVYGFEIITQ